MPTSKLGHFAVAECRNTLMNPWGLVFGPGLTFIVCTKVYKSEEGIID